MGTLQQYYEATRREFGQDITSGIFGDMERDTLMFGGGDVLPADHFFIAVIDDAGEFETQICRENGRDAGTGDTHDVVETGTFPGVAESIQFIKCYIRDAGN